MCICSMWVVLVWDFGWFSVVVAVSLMTRSCKRAYAVYYHIRLFFYNKIILEWSSCEEVVRAIRGPLRVSVLQEKM